jgi:anti-sigma factor RsiW
MNSDCQKYLEDPEAHAAHLAGCERCRAVFEQLDAPIAEGRGIPSVRIDSLPLAPWEGATHKSWPLVIGAILGVVAIAAGLFAIAGLSPITALTESVRANIPSVDLLGSMMRLAPGAIQNAPAGLQIAIAISFVVINALLFLRLRRAPKGIDA